MRIVIVVVCLLVVGCGSSSSGRHAPSAAEMQRVSGAVDDLISQCQGSRDAAAIGGDVQRFTAVLDTATLDASVRLDAGAPGQGGPTTLREMGGHVADLLSACGQDGLAAKVRGRLAS